MVALIDGDNKQVFPAGAGVIPDKKENIIRVISFPRRCGGDPKRNSLQMSLKRFSPQVRG